MSHNEPTLGIGTIIDVYHTLLEHGSSKEELSQAFGVNEADIYNPDTRIAASRLPLIWELAQSKTKDPAIGLNIGRDVRPESVSVVQQAFNQSKDIRQGLEHYIRFYRLVNETIVVSLEQTDSLAKVKLSVDPAFYHPSEIERSLSSAVARAKHFITPDYLPVSINFQHPEPPHSDQYHAVFGVSKINFSQPETSLTFDAKFLTYSPKNRNPYLFKALTHHAETLLKRIQPSSTTKDQVSSFIRKNLSKERLDVEMAAKHLNMTRQTLYRKLKKHNASFQSMVDEIRQEEAKELLRQDKASVSEVAFMLGFSELSAFSRAFKRWTGQSPAQYRQKGA